MHQISYMILAVMKAIFEIASGSLKNSGLQRGLTGNPFLF